MLAKTCPSRDELLGYVVGKLSDDDSESVSDHLDSCDTCQAEIATFDDGQDTLVGQLRLPALADPYLDESQCHVAMTHARAVAGRSGSHPGAGEPSVLGTTLGEYRLLAELGRGGMGIVYKALQTKLDRVVALKVLSSARVEDDRATARFEREMKAIGRLDHPNIVRAFDAREIEDKPVLIMEYVEGFDLAKVVRYTGPLATADACELVRQAALGLQYAHDNGLVHRDVKPSNLMLTPRGEVKLLDLGLARFHREPGAGEEMTGTGQAMGTADYMAPEQASDSHAVDIRADIYSLGCTLYKLLTGRAPFGGSRYQGAFDKMTAHVKEPIPPIGQFAPEIPEALVAVLDRMLAKDPEERFAIPSEVAEALESLCTDNDLTQLATQAAELEPSGQMHPYSSALIDTRPSGAPAPQPQTGSRFGGRKWIALMLGLMLGCLGGGIALGIIITIKDNGDVVVKVEGKGDRNIKIVNNAKKSASTTADIEAIQGTWKLVKVSKEPNMMSRLRYRQPGDDNQMTAPLSKEDIYETTRVTITEDAITFRDPNMVNTSFQYALNPRATPNKFIDVKYTGTLAQGLYELDGDQLMFCIAWERYTEGRVQHLRAESLWPGLGEDEQFALQRVGPAETSPDEKTIQGIWQVTEVAGKIDPMSFLMSGGGGMMGSSAEGSDIKLFSKSQKVTISRFELHSSMIVDETVSSGLGMGGMGDGMGGISLWASYVLDPRTTPGQIDMMTNSSWSGSASLFGLYQADEDRLTLYLGKQRPEKMDAKPGEDQVRIVLQRTAGAVSKTDDTPAAGGLTAVAQPPVTTRSDGSLIRGRWKGVSTGRDGTARGVTTVSIAISEHGFQYCDPYNLESPGQSYEYVLDSTKSPKEVTWHYDGKVVLEGIYEFVDAGLKIMYTFDGSPRPKSFEVTAYENAILLELRRDESKDAAAQDASGPLVIHIDKDARLWIANRAHDADPLRKMLPQNRDSLHKVLQQRLAKDPKLSVRLEAEPQCKHMDVVGILDLLKATGVDAAGIQIGMGVPWKPARLDFRIAITRKTDDTPGLDDAQIKLLEQQFGAKTEHLGAEWVEVRGDARSNLITKTHMNQTYALLSVKPDEVMLAGEYGKRSWGLEAVHIIKDAQDNLSVGVDFDAAGEKLLEKLTASHLKQPLAILLNGQVVCAPTIMTRLSKRAMITGSFDQTEVTNIVEALRAGMVVSAHDKASIEPGDVLKIQVVGTLPDEPIDGEFIVLPSGQVALAPSYGRVELRGMTLDGATLKIKLHLMQTLKNPQVQLTRAYSLTDRNHWPFSGSPYLIRPGDSVRIWVTGTLPDQPINGPFKVEPSGSVALGATYGRVDIGGQPLERAEAAIVEHLRKTLVDPRVMVTLPRSLWENPEPSSDAPKEP